MTVDVTREVPGELTAEQGRVLGVLVEKELTTPQGYPMTDSALVAACNQTTSRDPVVQYDIATVRIAVRELRELGLVRTVHRTGERSDKHRHELVAALGLSTPQTSLLAVLLLRGPQTGAQLGARAERMHAFADADEVEAELRVLGEREEPLVVQLGREPGRKEARYAQRWAVPHHGGEVAGPERAGAGAAAGGSAVGSLADLVREVAALREEMSALRQEVARLSGGDGEGTQGVHRP